MNKTFSNLLRIYYLSLYVNLAQDHSHLQISAKIVSKILRHECTSLGNYTPSTLTYDI